jgi:ABC-type multidrug transport system ATPase subunit
VDGVSFEVRAGTMTGLLGRNDAGKTTCLRMIFRVGILSYGKRPTIPELWRWLKVA